MCRKRNLEMNEIDFSYLIIGNSKSKGARNFKLHKSNANNAFIFIPTIGNSN